MPYINAFLMSIDGKSPRYHALVVYFGIQKDNVFKIYNALEGKNG